MKPLLVALILSLIGTIGAFAVQPEQTPLLGPDTAILFTMDGCPPCEVAKDTIEWMQDEGYDVIIMGRVAAKSYNVYSFPTLIIRKNNKEIVRRIGLLSDLEYRSLVPSKSN